MDTLLTISEVAARTGLSAHTLRYYERAGLISPVARAAGGSRRYAASDLEWIGFLLRLRETRMPIGQMQAFARLRSQGDASVPQRRQLLEAHLAEVLETIRLMQQAAKALQAKIAHYRALDLSPSSSTSSMSSTASDEGTPDASKPLRPRTRQAAGDRR